MNARFGPAGFLILCLFGIAAPSQAKMVCSPLKREVHSLQIDGYVVEIRPVGDASKGSSRWAMCRARVLSKRGVPVFSRDEHIIELHEITGKDINGDAKPDVVFEAYTGEWLHCCWIYWVVSLGQLPGLLQEIFNERGASFEDSDNDGRVEIWALDGAFDYFDGLAHAETVFPTVVLRLEGKKLVDVSAEFWQEYEKEIAEAQSKLMDEPLRQFRATKDIYSGENRKIVPLVLTVVLANLYGGQEQRAWKALDEMWPPHDKDRIRQLILETRAKGVLRYVHSRGVDKPAP